MIKIARMFFISIMSRKKLTTKFWNMMLLFKKNLFLVSGGILYTPSNLQIQSHHPFTRLPNSNTSYPASIKFLKMFGE